MAKQLYTTPKGIAAYPWLNKADDKFGPPTYKVDLNTDINEASELTAKLQDILDAHYDEVVEREGAGSYDEIKKADAPFWEDEDDKMVFRVKVNKDGKNKKTGETWENKVSFYDSNGRFMPEGKRPIVGNGSTIRVSFEITTYAIAKTEGKGKNQKKWLEVGISLRLKAIQVFSVQQGAGNASASAMGFEAEDGGYEYDPDAFDTDDAADGVDADAAGF